MDGNHITGVVFGFILGMYKAVKLAIISIMALGFISWTAVFDTAILALIGGAVGWCGAELMKWIKQFIKKRKYDKKSRKSVAKV